MLDILEELCRKIRPYEAIAGETNQVFQSCVEEIAQGSKGLGQMLAAFRRSINAFCGLHYDRSVRKPRVLVTGELLVNFHPGTNFHVVEYLEKKRDGDDPAPRITYQFRKDFRAAISEIRDFGAHLAPYSFALDAAVEGIQRYLERIAAAHPLYHQGCPASGSL